MPDGFTTLLDTPVEATADGSLTTRHPIAKLGKYKDRRYGEFAITAEDVEGWQRNMRELQNGRVPIDYDHGPEKGGSTEAAGWVTDIDLNGDKAEATIEWTPNGAQAIRDKRWLYVSPSFTSHMRDEQRKDRGPGLVGVGLTNRPFLKQGMPALSLSEDPGAVFAQPDEEGYELRDFTAAQRKQAAKKGNALPDGSFPINNTSDLKNAIQAYGRASNPAKAKAHIIARAKALGATNLLPDGWTSKAMNESGDKPGAMSELTKIAEVLSLDEDADEQAIVDAITDLKDSDEEKSLEDRAKDEGKVLLDSDSLTKLTEAANAGQAAAAELQTQKFTAAFEKAQREGRMDAKDETKDAYKALYDLDPAKTLSLIESAPKIVNTESKGSGGGTGERAEAPNGVDGEHFQLDQRVKAFMAEHDDVKDYSVALTRVLAEGATV